jgi:hypothetical protein
VRIKHAYDLRVAAGTELYGVFKLSSSSELVQTADIAVYTSHTGILHAVCATVNIIISLDVFRKRRMHLG